MKTQNLAILLTDIAGFTLATSKQSREENAAWLTMHGQLLRPVFAAFGGEVIKEIGDAFLTVFPSPTDAVLCGTALLDRLWAYNQTAPQMMRFDVRVVVNMGEVRLDRGEIYGEPVNVAARVEDVAEGGDVTITEAVFLTMNRSEVELEPLGSHTLKGIPEPVTLYRVKHLAGRAVDGELAKTYPFGGTQLHRLNAPAASNPQTGQLARSTSKAGQGGSAVRDVLDRVGDGVRAVPGGIIARLLVVGLVLAGGAWFGFRRFESWRSDPFRAIEDRLAAGDAVGAGDAWDKADAKKVKPRWKLSYYLGRVSALENNCNDALDGYSEALEAHPELSTDAPLNRDVATCLDSNARKRAIALIRDRIGKDAVSALTVVAEEKTRPAQARLSAVKLLENMGAADAITQWKILVQIVDSEDTCQERRDAVLKLAELKTRKALDDLKRIQRESEAQEGARAKQNKCLLGALGEAIRATEEAN